jgi:hypothetical protein
MGSLDPQGAFLSLSPGSFRGIWRVPQEAKRERALFAFIVASVNVIVVVSVGKPLALDEEPCLKGYANRWISS